MTCYFFPEGVDTSGEQLVRGRKPFSDSPPSRGGGTSWCGGFSKILRTIKSVHHVDDEIIKNGVCRNVQNLVSGCQKSQRDPPPLANFLPLKQAAGKHLAWTMRSPRQVADQLH